MTFQSSGQSIMLQNCLVRGGGWTQSSASTGSVLPPPRATSWMHWTARVWTPPPHDLLHGEKSEMFQRGGHGTSLQVRVMASGRRATSHSSGLTVSWSRSRTHSMIDSCTPSDHLKKINPLSFFGAHRTATFIAVALLKEMWQHC